MSPKSKVSVIIPTYNQPQFVVRAIRSVLAQTYQSFEILVMDDSRNDDTKRSVAEVIDSRVKYIHNPERLNFIENKNQGVRSADSSSRYIAFLDHDDEYLPLFLERTVAFLEADANCMAVCTDAEMRRQDGTFVIRYSCERKRFWLVGFGNGCLLRRDVFSKLNLWYDKNILFEDLDFGIHIAKDFGWGGIPEVLRIYYGYPVESGKSNSTSYTTATPQGELEGFWNKNKDIYLAAGGEATSFAQMLTGKYLMRAGYYSGGRRYIWDSFKSYPTWLNGTYCVMAWFVPESFRSIRMMIWKNKIIDISKRFFSLRS